MSTGEFLKFSLNDDFLSYCHFQFSRYCFNFRRSQFPIDSRHWHESCMVGKWYIRLFKRGLFIIAHLLSLCFVLPLMLPFNRYWKIHSSLSGIHRTFYQPKYWLTTSTYSVENNVFFFSQGPGFNEIMANIWRGIFHGSLGVIFDK